MQYLNFDNFGFFAWGVIVGGMLVGIAVVAFYEWLLRDEDERTPYEDSRDVTTNDLHEQAGRVIQETRYSIAEHKN